MKIDINIIKRIVKMTLIASVIFMNLNKLFSYYSHIFAFVNEI